MAALTSPLRTAAAYTRALADRMARFVGGRSANGTEPVEVVEDEPWLTLTISGNRLRARKISSTRADRSHYGR
jgi:hypothetical protein